jgi:hypothetical protein
LPGSKVIEAGNADLIVTFPDELLHDAVRKTLKQNIAACRGSILSARMRQHEEEEVRERGAVVSLLKPG